MSVQTY